MDLSTLSVETIKEGWKSIHGYYPEDIYRGFIFSRGWVYLGSFDPHSGMFPISCGYIPYLNVKAFRHFVEERLKKEVWKQGKTPAIISILEGA